jgi:MYXO-CTERM domain-containing protein
VKTLLGIAVVVGSFFLALHAAFAQDYRLPLEPPGSGTRPYVTAYRDHAAGGLRDWHCGTNTYDGHRGTDIGIGGFAVMDAGSRWVVAAADGEATTVIDGCFDRCTNAACGCGGGFGNYVRITHADGKSTYYGHLMNGSIQVRSGQRVTCGQRIGKVGSSGNSTGPHLHFEPRYSDNTSDDPFAGACGGPLSYWVDQGNYNDLPATRCENQAPPPPPPPAEGNIKGVIWDRSVTEGPNDGGNVRIVGATIEIAGGARTTSREGDAFWSFALAPGTYHLVSSAPGYVRAERDVTVTAGADSWASFGLQPEAPAEVDAAELVEQSVLNPLEIAPRGRFVQTWTLRNSGTSTWRASTGHRLRFEAEERFEGPAELALDASEAVAPGQAKTFTVELTAPADPGTYRGYWIMARGDRTFGPRLEAEAIVEALPIAQGEEEGSPPPTANPPIETPEGDSMDDDPKVVEDAGCGCRSGSPSKAAPEIFALLLAFFVLRRR